MTASTRERTEGRTLGCPLITRETVEREIPDNLAMSSIVNCDILTSLRLFPKGHLLLAKIWCTIGVGIVLTALGSFSKPLLLVRVLDHSAICQEVGLRGFSEFCAGLPDPENV